jgi:hypothetical protein
MRSIFRRTLRPPAPPVILRGGSMTLSALDLFTIGIGPSSSHTVGPMRAACRFVRYLESSGLAPRVTRLRCDLYVPRSRWRKPCAPRHAFPLKWCFVN